MKRIVLGARRVISGLRDRRNARVRLLARSDGGSVALSRLAATLRPGTAGGVSVEYRVGDAESAGIPLLTRSAGAEEWSVVTHFPTEGRAAKALCDLVLPPPAFRLNWRAAAATAAVVAAVLLLTPAPTPPVLSTAQAGGAAARPLNLSAPLDMPRPSIQAPPLASPGDEGLVVDMEELLSCDP
ncbi:hypothetical protein [Dolichospermum phage Dfl-JY45]